MERELSFPSGFIFGAATSAVGSEGASDASDWRIRERAGQSPASGNGNGKFNHYDEDFLSLAELGITNYRTSLDWSRIEPQKGVYNREAVENFRRLLQDAQRRGISVWLTLHHVSLPAWFSRLGGFMEETAIIYWHRYVEFAAKEFGGLVDHWIPIHEPVSYAAGAYLLGLYPPAKKRMDKFTDILIRLHQAHGDAYLILKKYLPARAKVGFSTLITPVTPRLDSDADRFACEFVDNFTNRLSLDALQNGAISVPGRGAIDLPQCKGAADFLGLDYFFRLTVGRGDCKTQGSASPALQELSKIEGMPCIRPASEGEPLSEAGYGAYPEGLYEAIKRVNQTGLNLPLFITASGFATTDDKLKADYHLRALVAVARALSQGLDVGGYFFWTDVDTYDWIKGFDMHYGLIGFDRETFFRRKREGMDLIGKIIHSRVIPAELVPEDPPEPKAPVDAAPETDADDDEPDPEDDE